MMVHGHLKIPSFPFLLPNNSFLAVTTYLSPDHGKRLLTGLVATGCSGHKPPNLVTPCLKSSMTFHGSWDKGPNPHQDLSHPPAPPCPYPVVSPMLVACALPSALDYFSLEGQAKLFLCREHSPFQISLVGLLTTLPIIPWISEIITPPDSAHVPAPLMTHLALAKGSTSWHNYLGAEATSLYSPLSSLPTSSPHTCP